MSTPRLCRFPGCDRPAAHGWTMCKRHHSAGGSTKLDRLKRAKPPR
jgi:hypothetical protein